MTQTSCEFHRFLLPERLVSHYLQSIAMAPLLRPVLASSATRQSHAYRPILVPQPRPIPQLRPLLVHSKQSHALFAPHKQRGFASVRHGLPINRCLTRNKQPPPRTEEGRTTAVTAGERDIGPTVRLTQCEAASPSLLGLAGLVIRRLISRGVILPHPRSQ